MRVAALVRPLLSSLVVLLLLQVACVAGDGDRLSLPAFNGKKVKNGIAAEVDYQWTSGFGYRPVRVKLTPTKSTRDRTIRVVILPENYSSTSPKPMEAIADIEVPQGTESVTQTINVPQYTPWTMLRIEFFENGRQLKDLSMTRSYRTSRTNGGESPSILLVDSHVPDLSKDRKSLLRNLRRNAEQRTTFPDAGAFQFTIGERYGNSVNREGVQYTTRSTDAISLDYLETMDNLELIPPQDIPTNYQGLIGVDLIVLSIKEIDRMATEFPQRLQAIEYYVRSGGNLVVFGVDAEASLTDLFQLSGTWRKANEFGYPTGQRTNYRDAVNTRKSRQKKPESTPDASLMDHGLGIIFAWQTDDPYASSDEMYGARWLWMMNCIGHDRLTFTKRMGMSTIRDNDDYWDFMIPGFGASPVNEFLGVITLFILGIGPLNYYLLSRMKRLHLLPVTVGLAAFLTTATMMCYAFVSDGVSTRVRLRSYTQLDQTSGESVAATHCRQAYLAAFAPSGGLKFPLHACVYPVTPIFETTRSYTVNLDQRNDRQILRRGFLRPRTTTQFMTTAVQSIDQRINLADGIDEAVNHLGARLTHCWIRDDAGKLFYADDVAPGAKIEFAPMDDTAGQDIMSEHSLANVPAPPEGLDKNADNWMLSGSRYSRYSYMQASIPSKHTSLIHKQIFATDSFFKRGQPKTFLVVTESAPDFIHVGTNASEEAGYHVIRGTW